MARTRKSIQPLNLRTYDVLIEDKNLRSDYFKISQFDGYFYGGRNAFLIAGATVLRANTQLLVEILDANGNTVYSSAVASFVEGSSRLIKIEVYSNTPIGPGKIIIIGCAATYLNGEQIPEEWKDKFNVRWVTDVIISPLVENKTPIRFYKNPSMDLIEKFYFQPSSSLLENKIQIPVDIELSPKYTNVQPSGYLMSVTGPTTSTRYTSDQLNGNITGTLFLANATVSQTASIKLPITTIYNRSIAETDGLVYTTDGTILLNSFLSSSGTYTRYISPFGVVSATSNINIQYDKITTYDTSTQLSFAKIRLVDLNTISGEVHKIRLSYKPSTDPAEYVLLGDVNTKVNEILAVDSGSKVLQTGQFNTIPISNYWYNATMSLDKGVLNPTLPSYYKSSLSGSSTISQCCIDLLDGINATPQIVNGDYIDGVSYFIGTADNNPVLLFPRSEYTLAFDAFVNKNSGSVKLEQSDYSMEVYLVDISGSSTKLINVDQRGQLLGTLTPSTNFTVEGFNSTEFNFIPNIITSGKFGIRFVVYGGHWSIARVSMKVAQEPYFSPDEVDILIPNINYRDKILTFKADYLDINNNSVGISTISLPTYFTGSESTAVGGDTSVVISTTPPVGPSVGNLWWNSEEGQLKIYYSDGDSSQWVDASGESIETGSFGGGGSSVSSSYPFSVSGSTLYSTYDISSSNFSTANAILIGTKAGDNTTDADYTVFIGTEAGALSTASHDSIYIGEHAGRNSNESYWSNYIGQYAGTNASESFWSNYIGPYAGDSSTNGHFSNFIGPNAGNNSTDGNFSNFLGENAGGNSTKGEFSNYIGAYAGDSSMHGYFSNFIGGDAGYSSDSGSYSNFIGNYTGRYTLGASYSTLIGYNVGTAVGAGMSIKSNNIIIGTNITLEADRQDSINLGGIIFASGSYSTTTGNPYSGSVGNGKVGINVVNPQYTVHVSGTFGFSPNNSVTPINNGDVVIEATDNTTLTFKLKGSDGVVRSGSLALS